MLLPRILTALVGAPLLLVLIHLGSWPFLLLCTGAAALSLHEYALMLRLGGRPIQAWPCVLGGGALAFSVGLGRAGGLGALGGDLSGLVVAVLLLVVMGAEMAASERSLERAALTVFGAFFIGWTLAHMALLRELRPHGEGLTYLLFVTIWTADSAAYFVGRSVGRRRLAPTISPGKTWEGAAAGFAGAMLAVLLGRAWFLRDAFGPGVAAALGALVGVIGPVSDLSESVIKRAVGVKDSSSILPGHGGVLDRFDALLFCLPAVYFLARALKVG
jgi:phosphatidate cytidylyltransferase